MGATRKRIGLAAALFGKARLAVLTLLFGTPDEAFYLRQISAFAGVGQGAVQREVERLTQAGLVLKTRRGQHVYYQANRSCAVFTELSSFVRKSAAVADVISNALKPLRHEISLAFIYGSQASGTATATSDIDLLVVGDVDALRLHKAVSKAEHELQRPVNYTLMTIEEFNQRRGEAGGFLDRVLGGGKIPILGGTDEV